MKDKVTHFFAAFFVYGLSMFAITYMIQNEINWTNSILFGTLMALADVLFLKKLRDKKQQ